MGMERMLVSRVICKFLRIESHLIVTGMMDLSTFIDKAQSECLNEDDDHPYSHCLTSGELMISCRLNKLFMLP